MNTNFSHIATKNDLEEIITRLDAADNVVASINNIVDYNRTELLNRINLVNEKLDTFRKNVEKPVTPAKPPLDDKHEHLIYDTLSMLAKNEKWVKVELEQRAIHGRLFENSGVFSIPFPFNDDNWILNYYLVKRIEISTAGIVIYI